MPHKQIFSILDNVESTNNYAMQQVREEMAINGQAWFAKNQWGGKGQRGKTWESEPAQNIILTIALQPHKLFFAYPYIFSSTIANICRQFFEELAEQETKIKWPNDIYCSDRKAGGILIENIYTGNNWQWAIVGIGINVNQTIFAPENQNAQSLKLLTGKKFDSVELAEKLHQKCILFFEKIDINTLENSLKELNDFLYKKNELVKLKKDNVIFETTIKAVNKFGQLITEDGIHRVFEVGEVVFLNN